MGGGLIFPLPGRGATMTRPFIWPTAPSDQGEGLKDSGKGGACAIARGPKIVPSTKKKSARRVALSTKGCTEGGDRPLRHEEKGVELLGGCRGKKKVIGRGRRGAFASRNGLETRNYRHTDVGGAILTKTVTQPLILEEILNTTG